MLHIIDHATTLSKKHERNHYWEFKCEERSISEPVAPEWEVYSQ